MRWPVVGKKLKVFDSLNHVSTTKKPDASAESAPLPCADKECEVRVGWQEEQRVELLFEHGEPDCGGRRQSHGGGEDEQAGEGGAGEEEERGVAPEEAAEDGVAAALWGRGGRYTIVSNSFLFLAFFAPTFFEIAFFACSFSFLFNTSYFSLECCCCHASGMEGVRCDLIRCGAGKNTKFSESNVFSNNYFFKIT